MNVRIVMLLVSGLTLAAGLACALPFARPTETPLPIPTEVPPTQALTATEALLPTEGALPTAVQLPTALIEPVEFAEFSVPDEGVAHIPEGQAGEYEHYPPSSGQHYARILEWNYYVEEVPPEYYVHNLEHGGIVVLYNCPTGCPETEALLDEFYAQAPPEDVFNSVKIIIGTSPLIETRVVALAWGYQLNLPDANVEALLDFYRRHVNQGPELVP